MIRPARALPSLPPMVGTALHRRRAPVIVRAPGNSSSIQVSPAERRRRSPTLPGIGYRMEEDTIPILEHIDDEPPPVSMIRAKELPPAACAEAPSIEVPRPATSIVTPESRAPASVRIPKAAPIPRIRAAAETLRPRPVTLIDDVHDRVSRGYLEEAERILASGILDRS